MDAETENIIHYIREKAESRGWENAEYYACEKFGEEKTKKAMEKIDEPTREQCFNSMDVAIETLLRLCPEFEEEHTTGWDMVNTLKFIKKQFN